MPNLSPDLFAAFSVNQNSLNAFIASFTTQNVVNVMPKSTQLTTQQKTSKSTAKNATLSAQINEKKWLKTSTM